MIIEMLIGWAVNVATFVVGLLPTWEPPAFMVDLDGTLNTFISGFGQLGAWVPWNVGLACMVLVFALWVGGLIAKGTRALLAHAPQVGGAG